MDGSETYGVFHRTRDGRWLYPWGDEVPGARDLTVRDARRLGLAVADDLAPAVSAAATEDHEFMEPAPASRPNADCLDDHDRVVGISAPELDVRAMLVTADIADLLGVEPDTIAAYRHRGYLPEPQATVGRTPVWSRPVIRHWVETRPGSGWRTDMYGDREEYDEYLHHRRAARRTRRTATSAST